MSDLLMTTWDGSGTTPPLMRASGMRRMPMIRRLMTMVCMQPEGSFCCRCGSYMPQSILLGRVR